MKRWIGASFNLYLTKPKITKKEAEEQAEKFLRTFNFFMEHLEERLDIVFKKKVNLKITKIKDEYELEISIEPLTSKEFFEYGTLLYSINARLCEAYQLDFQPGQDRIIKIDFNKKGEPIEISKEGLIELNYRMKDRISETSHEYDYNKYFGSVEDTIKEMKASKNPNVKKWMNAVEKLL